ncbi:hypothetical protein JL09_g6201 [Pichia kudriavzevii]|uniref:Uncharacterized protein n=1 Tax=Pichia kudriavzevii TaxID=4909 RepID=A0A099NRX2_PICKU|nr:hypothetical protein JL09_g6201 [Pichia kudriavzevii]
MSNKTIALSCGNLVKENEDKEKEKGPFGSFHFCALQYNSHGHEDQ